MRAWVLLLLLVLLPLPARAGFERICRENGVPPLLVLSIMDVESSRFPWCVTVAGREHRPRSLAEAAALARRAMQAGRSVDLGLMQISDWWLRRLKLSPETVLRPEINLRLGLAILRGEIRRHGPGWKAVGAYHSPTPSRRRAYARRVARRWAALAALPASAAPLFPALRDLPADPLLPPADTRDGRKMTRPGPGSPHAAPAGGKNARPRDRPVPEPAGSPTDRRAGERTDDRPGADSRNAS